MVNILKCPQCERVGGASVADAVTGLLTERLPYKERGECDDGGGDISTIAGMASISQSLNWYLGGRSSGCGAYHHYHLHMRICAYLQIPPTCTGSLHSSM